MALFPEIGYAKAAQTIRGVVPMSALDARCRLMCSPQAENCNLPHCQCGCASQQIQMADVCFGSKADIEARLSNVRFTPKADIRCAADLLSGHL
jgi:hypothetical protein